MCYYNYLPIKAYQQLTHLFAFLQLLSTTGYDLSLAKDKKHTRNFTARHVIANSLCILTLNLETSTEKNFHAHFITLSKQINGRANMPANKQTSKHGRIEFRPQLFAT